MRLIRILKMSLISLKINKLRTFLSTLGIIVGVSSLILITALGAGAQDSILSSINSLGSDVVIIMPGKNTNLFKSAIGASATRKPLVYDDAKYLKKKMPYVKVAPEINLNVNAKYKNIEISTTAVGTNQDIFTVFNYVPIMGRVLTKKDIAGYKNVCVLGYKVFKELFPKGVYPIGKDIIISDNKYTVIGVLRQKGSLNQLNMDDFVFIPITVMEIKARTDRVQFIFTKPPKGMSINALGVRIKSLLIAKHGVENFSLSSENQYIRLEKKVAEVLSLTLALIGLIALVVGGIGIMNIMLASVAERTREIGIRKAVGAKDIDILVQFLFESTLIATSGGILGVAIGIAGSILFPKNIIPAHITPLSILIGLLVSSFTGIFFGVYPARKAAGMNPVECLRYE